MQLLSSVPPYNNLIVLYLRFFYILWKVVDTEVVEWDTLFTVAVNICILSPDVMVDRVRRGCCKMGKNYSGIEISPEYFLFYGG